MLLTCHSTRHSPHHEDHPAPGGRRAEVKKPGLNEVLLLLLIYRPKPFPRQLASERDHESLAKAESPWALRCSGECTAPWHGLSVPPRHADCVAQQIRLDLVGAFPASSCLAGVSRRAWPLESGKHGMVSILSASSVT